MMWLTLADGRMINTTDVELIRIGTFLVKYVFNDSTDMVLESTISDIRHMRDIRQVHLILVPKTSADIFFKNGRSIRLTVDITDAERLSGVFE
jgi:hypothetical protein